MVWKCDSCGKSFCEKHKHRRDHDCVSPDSDCPRDQPSGSSGLVEGSPFLNPHLHGSAREMISAVESRHAELDLMDSGKVHANVKSSALLKVTHYVDSETTMSV